MAAQNVIRTLTIRSKTEGVSETTAAMKGLQAAHEGVAKSAEASARVTDTSAKGQLSLADSVAKAERRFNTALRAQQDLEKVQRQMNLAVAQNPALQERATAVIELARQRMLAATAANDNFGRGTRAAFQTVQSEAQALAGRLGVLGSALSALGPAGLALAAFGGAAAFALHQAADAALKLADRAGKLKDFAETTGFTVIELQALEKAGAQVGVSSESVTKALERFSVQMVEVRLRAGETYEKLLAVDAGLARQVSTATSLSKAYELVATAIKRADLAQANEIAKAFFGRGGVEQTRLLRAVSDADGLRGLISGLHEADIITAKQAERWDTLGDKIAENMKAAKQNLASVFTEDMLLGMERFSKSFLEFSREVKQFGINEDLKRFMEFFSDPAVRATIAGALAGGLIAGPGGALVGASVGAIAGGQLREADARAAADAAKEATEEWEKLNHARDKAINGIIHYGQVAATAHDPVHVKEAANQMELYGSVLDRVEKRITALGIKSAEVKPPATLPPDIEVGVKKVADAQEAARIATIASYNEMARWMAAIGSAATLAERYELAALKLNAAKAQGAIDGDQYTRAITAQKEQLEKSLGVASLDVIVTQRVAQVREVAAKAGLTDEQTRLAVAIAQREAAERFMQAWARANPMLAEIRDNAVSAAQSLAKDIANSVAPMDALTNAAKKLNEALIDIALRKVASQLISSAVTGLSDTATQAAGATTAAGILTTASTTMGATWVAAATQAAAILGVGGTTAGTAVTAGGAVGGTEVAVGGATGGAALAAGGTVAGAAIWGPIALLVAAIAVAVTLFGNNTAEKQRQAAAIQGYRDRAMLAGVDTQTLAGQLAQFDTRARAEQAGLPNAGLTQKTWTNTLTFGLFGDKGGKPTQELMELQKAQEAERLKIIRDFGIQSVEAEKKAAADRLQVLDDFNRAMNEVQNKSFLNDFADLFKQIATYQTAGADPARLTEFLSLSAQGIVDDAKLTGTAFTDLITKFPQLNGVVHEFSETIESLARSLEDITNAQRSFQDRLFTAGNDSSTVEGALAAFDRAANQERAEEVRVGGQALVDLDAALGAERLGILRDFNDHALEEQNRADERALEEQNRADERALEEQRRADERVAQARLSAQDRLVAATNDATTLEGQLAAQTRQFQRERQEEERAGGLAMVDLLAAQQAEELRLRRDFGQRAIEETKRQEQEKLDASERAARTVVDYLHEHLGGPASTEAPGVRLNAAQTAFNAQSALALTGDIDAQSTITQVAENLRLALRDMFGSSSAYQQGWSAIQDTLLSLPAVVNTDDPLTIALRDAAMDIRANTTATGLNTTGVGANTTGVGSNTTAVGNNTTTVSTSVNSMSGSITSLATSTVGLDGSVTSLGTSVTSQGTSINSLGTSTTTLGGNVASLGSNVTNQGTSINSLGTSTTTLGNNVGSLGTNVTNQSTSISSLGTSISGSGGLSSNVSSLATSVGQSGIAGSVDSLATSVGQSGIAGSVDSLATSVGSGGLGGSVTSLATQVGDQNSGISTIAQNTLNTRGSVDALGNNIATTATNTGSISTVASNTGAISSVAQNTLNTRFSVDSLGNNIATTALNTGPISTVAANTGGISSVAQNTLNTRFSVDALSNGIQTTANNTGLLSTVANNTGGIATVSSHTGNLTSISTNTANTRGSVDALGSGGLAQIVTNTGASGTLVTALGPGGNVVTALIGSGGVVQVIGASTQQTADNVGANDNSGIRGILAVLNNSISNATLSVTYQGSSVSNNMLNALNKIVANTYAIADNTGWRVTTVQTVSTADVIRVSNLGGHTNPGILAEGGWIGGRPHSQGGTNINAELGEFMVREAIARNNASWLPEFNRSGRMPSVPVPMPFASGVANDNSALLARIDKLTAEVERLQQIVSGSGARIAQAVVEKSDEIIDSTDRQTDELGREMRQEKRRAA